MGQDVIGNRVGVEGIGFALDPAFQIGIALDSGARYGLC